MSVCLLVCFLARSSKPVDLAPSNGHTTRARGVVFVVVVVVVVAVVVVVVPVVVVVVVVVVFDVRW